MKKRMVLVGVVLALAVAVLFGATPALATTGTTDRAQGTKGPANSARLENLFERQQTLLTKQQERLAKAEQIATKAEEWIAKLQEEGKDTEALEEAFENFVAEVDKAEGHLATAASVLAAHAGFDADGQVTDKKQALKTVRDAGKAQRQFHLIIVKAVADFRHDVREFREGLD